MYNWPVHSCAFLRYYDGCTYRELRDDVAHLIKYYSPTYSESRIDLRVSVGWECMYAAAVHRDNFNCAHRPYQRTNRRMATRLALADKNAAMIEKQQNYPTMPFA